MANQIVRINKMLIKRITFVFCTLSFCANLHESCANDDDNGVRTVETKSGKIRGILRTTILNEIPYYSFKGLNFIVKNVYS